MSEHSKKHNYKILKTYTVEEIKAHGKNDYFYDKEVTDRKIKLSRAHVYNKRGVECSEDGCELSGYHYAVGEDNGGGIHLDLYAYDKEGDLVMMTVDHIKPTSKGGKDTIDNKQPMCMPHNMEKANDWNFNRKFIDLNTIYPDRELITQNYKIYKSALTEKEVEIIKQGDECIAKDYIDDFEVGKEYVVLEKRDEGVMMSDHPSETMTNQHFIDQAYGDVLIFGLGIGMIILPLLNDKDINSITVVEKDQGLISIVTPILQRHDKKNKLKVVHGDVFTHHKQMENDWHYVQMTNKRKKRLRLYDTIYFDIWIRVEPEQIKEMEQLHDTYSKFRRSDKSYVTSWLYDIKDTIYERNPVE